MALEQGLAIEEIAQTYTAARTLIAIARCYGDRHEGRAALTVAEGLIRLLLKELLPEGVERLPRARTPAEQDDAQTRQDFLQTVPTLALGW